MQGLKTEVGPVPASSRERALVWELAKRDVMGRYRGASLGVAWSLIQPFLMLVVYTVAFGQILKSRWPGADDTASFAVILFVGILVHGFFAECVSKAPGLVAGNANYVKRIVFPLEVLPWPALLSALFHVLANTVVLLIFLLALGKTIHWTVVLFPLVLLPLAILSMGVMWAVSSVSVYFRDVSQIIGPVVTAMFFLSSAVIPVEALPQEYQLIFNANPLTMIIDQSRVVLLDGRPPDVAGLALYSIAALAVFVGGFAVFRRLREGFSDVL